MWHLIKQAVPQFNIQEQAKLYQAVLRGDLQVTMGYDSNGLIGIIITLLYTDPILQNKMLMIYGIKTVRRLTPKKWKAVFKELVYQANSLGCDCISTYTPFMSVRRMLGKLGARELTYVWLQI